MLLLCPCKTSLSSLKPFKSGSPSYCGWIYRLHIVYCLAGRRVPTGKPAQANQPVSASPVVSSFLSEFPFCPFNGGGGKSALKNILLLWDLYLTLWFGKDNQQSEIISRGTYFSCLPCFPKEKNPNRQKTMEKYFRNPPRLKKSPSKTKQIIFNQSSWGWECLVCGVWCSFSLGFVLFFDWGGCFRLYFSLPPPPNLKCVLTLECRKVAPANAWTIP